MLQVQVQRLAHWLDAKEIVRLILIARYVSSRVVTYLCIDLSLLMELFTILFILISLLFFSERLVLYVTNVLLMRLSLAAQGLVLREQTIAVIVQPIIFSMSRQIHSLVPCMLVRVTVIPMMIVVEV